MIGARLFGMLLAAAAAMPACSPGASADPAPSPAASVFATAAASASASASAPVGGIALDERLEFVKDGRQVRSLTLREITTAVAPETWTSFDPYYERKKTYRAVPLAAVLRKGFGEDDLALAEHDYVLRARDGYTVPLPGKKLLEPGGYLALEDVEVPGWEPIGPRRANPGPVYLVWRNDDQQKLETHPRPWQLAAIEIARFETTFPHTVPTGGSPAAYRGFKIFREQCILCHAINREGGRVGPDLNVPKSIVEYRPVQQIKEYIRDPLTFRYGTMPAHPHLGPGDLDDLVAYFSAMKDNKHDPTPGRSGH